MPIPNSMADLSTLAGSNSPAGTESIGNSLDDYIRSLAAIIRSTNAVAGSTIAAASTTDIGQAGGESVIITGSSAINSFGPGFIGCYRELRFTGTPTILNSSNIALPGGVNLTVSLNDVLGFRCTGSGGWTLVNGSADRGAVRKTGDTMTGPLIINPTSGIPLDLYTGSGRIAFTNANGRNSIQSINVGNTANVDLGLDGKDIYLNPSGGRTIQNGTLDVYTGAGRLFISNQSAANSIESINTGNTDRLDFRITTKNLIVSTVGGSTQFQGSVSATGDITGNSDESLKENWRSLPPGFVNLLSKVKAGTYDRKDISITQDGVSAQSLAQVLPNCVREGEGGILSVAYGNAALVSAIELAIAFVGLDERLSKLEGVSRATSN